MIKGMKIYKYTNRKYYVVNNEEASPYKPGYTDLKGILEFTKSGVLFSVVDYKTKNDITCDTIFDAVHAHLKGRVPKATLEQIVCQNYVV